MEGTSEVSIQKEPLFKIMSMIYCVDYVFHIFPWELLVLYMPFHYILKANTVLLLQYIYFLLA